MKKEETIKKLEQVKNAVNDPKVKKDIQDKINKLSDNKTVTK